MTSTFPERLKPLAEKFYQQALSHPAYLLMSPSEVRQSVENRLFSFVKKSPWWFGQLASDRPKRAMTEAQLQALKKARLAKAALTEEELLRERRINERIEASSAA
ncbi:MAG: hypothetical protein NDI90_04300 [Nitrospira sp. BO4]|jgi:CO dehydrogenase/acetyl-CoA synthase alpha subunit|nr:hypothetical protein [Nitrospira sp. BO4]